VFTLHKESAIGAGTIHTMHGEIETPVFLPCCYRRSMRGITLEDLQLLDPKVLLCNTYHLHIHPGEEIVAAAGGLHKFIGWEGPILTDSGGSSILA